VRGGGGGGDSGGAGGGGGGGVGGGGVRGVEISHQLTISRPLCNHHKSADRAVHQSNGRGEGEVHG